MNAVHPTAVIGPGVDMGKDNVIGAYAVIQGPTVLGDGNWIGPHVVIGSPAEIRGTDHGHDRGGVGTGLRIGNCNVVREFTTMHQGHFSQTVVGDDCYLMNKVYIAHDCVIGDQVTMASTATLGGHVRVGDGANLGMGAVVHQRRVIGPGTMIGMAAVVTRDIPPYACAYGNPARVRGANRVGMQRSGVAEATMASLDLSYASGGDPAVPDDPKAAAAWAWWMRAGGLGSV